ncbi:MAG: GAF domain-containing protein [Dysgonamonadaceae bacterium]|nr:GAF domain-containing protein [Dysgonamonadaceae bacterium]
MKQLFKNKQSRYDYRQIFLDFNRSLYTIKEKTSLISSIVTRIYELVQAKNIYILWQNQDTTRYVLMNPQEETSRESYILSDDGLIKWLQLNEKPLTVSFLPEYANIFSENDRKTVTSLNCLLICPLKTNNQLRGVIFMGEKEDKKAYGPKDMEILSVLLDNTALAIENISYNEERLAHLKRMMQTDRLSVIGQLAAGAAHEIRNPLTSIKSAIQYIQGDINDPKKQKIIHSTLSEVNRINEILAGLLSFSRQNNPVKREFDLTAMIEQTLRFIRNTQLKKQIRFVVRPVDLPLPVAADRDQLKQVIINILLNAIEAIRQDGIIGIEIQSSIMEGTAYYHIIVTDNGTGIHEDQLEKIFDPFYTTKEEGTGLGLSISYGIIHSHGGNIEIRNHPDGGTQVEIRLPKGIPNS